MVTENDDIQKAKTAQKLYDLCMIENLCRGNKDQVKEMVAVFIGQMPKAVEEMGQASHENDFAKVKNVAHRIRPVLGYYAVAEMENELREIEVLAEMGIVAKGSIELKITKLDAVITEIVAQMKQAF